MQDSTNSGRTQKEVFGGKKYRNRVTGEEVELVEDHSPPQATAENPSNLLTLPNTHQRDKSDQADDSTSVSPKAESELLDP
jgi:hypothetical protein